MPDRWVLRLGEGRWPVVERASQGPNGDGMPPSPEGTPAISIVRPLPGPEVTFIIAGFLKIVTIGGLAHSAPVDAARTAAGQLSPYLMVPVGLLMCWIAKLVVDNGLHESKRFGPILTLVLLILYFGVYRILFRYSPRFGEVPHTARAATSSQAAHVRAQLGDREIGGPAGGVMLRNTRAYVEEEGGRAGQYDDLAWYEGRYASQLGPAEQDSAASTAVLEARNPARKAYRRVG